MSKIPKHCQVGCLSESFVQTVTPVKELSSVPAHFLDLFILKRLGLGMTPGNNH